MTVPPNRPISVHVWSDVACPWCYIGRAHFDAGVALFEAQHPDAPPVDVEFHSFELSPDTPVDFDGGEIDFLVGHKGIDATQAQSMIDRVTSVAADAGLEMRFDRIRHTNTRLAHEVLHAAKAVGVQREMKDRLLRAYFTEGRHIGRVEELVALAAEVGLDVEEVRRALDDGAYRAAVDDDVAQARALGIGGVPFFVVDGKFGVSGAHPPEAFAEVFTEALEARRATIGG